MVCHTVTQQNKANYQMNNFVNSFILILFSPLFLPYTIYCMAHYNIWI